MARQRSTANYLQSAKSNARFIPSLRKYGRRKRLTPQEKSAIARAENNLKGLGNLAALSKRQHRNLDRDRRLGKGIRAIPLNVAEPGDSIGTNKRGEITVKTGKRRWRFIPEAPELGALIDAGKRAFKRRSTRQVFLWNSRGRAGEGARDFETFVDIVTGFFAQYANIGEWLLGIVTLSEA